MPDLVTRRPQRGSAYHSSVSYTEENWEKIEEPGGRHLWIKLVVASIGLAVLGTVLLALGSILFRTAMDFEEDGNTGLPLGLCVVSIVSGCIMFCGSVFIARTMISNKWRTNEKPDYRRTTRRSARVHYAVPTTGDREAQVEIDLPPPPYDQNVTTAPSIFFVTGDLHIQSDLPPPADMRLDPPEYTDESAKPPSYSAVNPLAVVHLPPANTTGRSRDAPRGNNSAGESHRNGTAQEQENRSPDPPAYS